MIEPRHRTIVDIEGETFLRLTAECKPDRGPDRAAMRDDDDVPALLLGVGMVLFILGVYSIA